MGDSAYSFSLTTFSPSGKLLQIEYALTAVAAGATSLGIKVCAAIVPLSRRALQNPAGCGQAAQPHRPHAAAAWLRTCRRVPQVGHSSSCSPTARPAQGDRP